MSEQNDANQQMKSNLGRPTSVVFSFDTTGSMQPCIAEVRKRLRDLAKEMARDIPGLRIGLIAHGDYCDGQLCISVLDLTEDIEKIMAFIATAPDTSGGDAPECYELVLQTAKGMAWPKEGGSLVLIGDDQPHMENPGNIDWRSELRQLRAANVRVFPMQCLFRDNRKAENAFWLEVAEISGTPLLVLESFADSSNTLEAATYASAGAAAYDVYKTKTGGLLKSANLCSNEAKLESFVASSPKPDAVIDEGRSEEDKP